MYHHGILTSQCEQKYEIKLRIRFQVVERIRQCHTTDLTRIISWWYEICVLTQWFIMSSELEKLQLRLYCEYIYVNYLLKPLLSRCHL